ncbi:MAG: TlyA family rRNA (cytidine-2'-O)-methyltransferase [Acidobacteriota bacterium]
MKKERIDKLLADRGFAESRAKAQAMIMAGVVLIGEKRIDKASELIEPNAPIRIKGQTAASQYVGRGGLKLEAALQHFQIDPTEDSCMDVGSSTGGFTDCLLQHGAASVVALDVGTNQLAWKLRSDPRVDVRENVNARNLVPDDFKRLFDLIVMDVSFISVTKIFPALFTLLRDGARVVVLIKPQFEVGKGEVGKGGIVRDPQSQERVVREINSFAAGLGFEVIGTIESPITGAEGNREFLSCYQKRLIETDNASGGQRLVEGDDYSFENGLMVLTSSFLLKRGYCCGSGCRNCPYPESDRAEV